MEKIDVFLIGALGVGVYYFFKNKEENKSSSIGGGSGGGYVIYGGEGSGSNYDAGSGSGYPDFNLTINESSDTSSGTTKKDNSTFNPVAYNLESGGNTYTDILGQGYSGINQSPTSTTKKEQATSYLPSVIQPLVAPASLGSGKAGSSKIGSFIRGIFK